MRGVRVAGPRRRLAWRGMGCTAVVLLALARVTPAAAQETGSLTLQVLSNRADLVSGGSALLEVVLPNSADAPRVVVDVDGHDVTQAFAIRPNGRFEGLLTGLKTGPNLVTARDASGGSQITITDHPISGPIFSGPQIQPWYCLTGAVDKQCNRPITYTWYYHSTDDASCLASQQVAPCFLPYDPSNPPSSVPTTTTDQGKTVPYIVRLEAGNMDRSQYRLAVLADPAAPFDRWSGPLAWNHKVFEGFGAGCSTGHDEGPAPNVFDDIALSRGFISMSTSLSDDDYNCNLVVQAESVMMLKEHVVEAYGDVRYTFGAGCSGGSIASLTTANAYPGLYDGLIVGCTMPDVPINDLLDCKGLLNYWNNPTSWAPGVVWTEAQEASAAGLASTSVCHTWVEAYHYPDVFNPTTGVGCGIPTTDQGIVYNAQTNPKGLRCSFQDYLGNVLGLRPPDRWGPIEKAIGQGFANRPYDNVGVLYGLRALQSGSITPSQFADLNAKVGGINIDYAQQPQRIDADPDAISRAYRSGLVDEANNLNQIAIIDLPGLVPGDRYEIHDNQKSWGLDARLLADTGTNANHVMWQSPDQSSPFRNGNDIMGDGQAFAVMDEWMSAVEKDHSNLSQSQKVLADKPADAHNICELPDPSTCTAVFGPAGNARYASGEHTLANDVIKCQLKPLIRTDYTAQFTDAEWAQLQAAFPTGVCDWGRLGVAQQPAVGWQTYAGGPGGQPLGTAPVAQPVQPAAAVPEAPLQGWLLVVGIAAVGTFSIRSRRRRSCI